MSEKVFVVGTGRCGTVTFYHACTHAVNYTARHEQFGRLGNAGRLFFPPYSSIEIGSQLSIFIPRLRREFPDARWVHLIRNREDCIPSIAAQCEIALWAFSQQWLQNSNPDFLQAAALLYDTVNDLCYSLLPNTAFRLNMEEAYERWPECWQYMRCRGNLELSQQEWLKQYNPGVRRGLHSFIKRPKTSIIQSSADQSAMTPIAETPLSDKVTNHDDQRPILSE